MRLSQADAQRIVAQVSSAIDRDINIMDENGVIMASTNPARIAQRHQGAQRVLTEGLDMLVIDDATTLTGVQQGINLPIRFREEIIGVIGITGRPEEVSAFGRVIRQMTEILVESIWRQEQSTQLEQAKNLFLESWLFADPLEEEALEMRARLLGIELSAPRTVVALEIAPESGGGPAAGGFSELQSSKLLDMIRRHLADDSQSFCAVIHRHILLLLRETSQSDTEAHIRQIAREVESFFSVRVFGGISTVSTSCGDLRRCYNEAKNACRTAVLSGQKRLLFAGDLSLDAMLQTVPESMKRQLVQTLFSGCTPAERAECLQTLRLYYQCEGNVEKAAAQLYLHKNTFQYRLHKLQARTGYRIRDPRGSMVLYCGLKFSQELTEE